MIEGGAGYANASRLG
jgi:hypothetical protein